MASPFPEMLKSRRDTVPFKTLETNIIALEPQSIAVRSQGPSRNVEYVNDAIAFPQRLIAIKEPCLMVAKAPSFVGTLPTKTTPRRRTASAVLRPSPV